MKQILYSDFVEINLSFIPRYLSKYASITEDIKSLYNYYILRKRPTYSLEKFTLATSPSTICNANCVFCAKKYLKDKVCTMPTDNFKKLIDQYKELGNYPIGTTPTIGESFVDPNFIEKIQYMKDNEMECSFYTNAILLEKYMEDILNLEIKEIYLDIADIIPEYDSKVFQIPLGVSKNRLDAILKFLEQIELRQSKTKVTLAFRSMRSPKEIFKDMKDTKFYYYYKRKLIKLSFLQAFDNWGGLIKQEDLLGIQTLKRAPKIKKYPCRSLFQISFLPNGNFRLCGCRCLTTMKDELVMGNIKDTSLKDIVHSKKWKDLIDNFENDMPKVCRDCSFYRPKIK